ncbi:MAG: MFS transporter, partial [Nocardioidaceae bacterium]
LPRHGYSFSQTPLWAGIYMLPMTAGFLVAGPTSGWLSDRFGARTFATGGMLVAAGSFFWLLELPVNFSYWQFAIALLINGLGMGLFAAPNRTGIMNSLPANQRGVGAGMSTVFSNSSMVLSIGIFFSLMITGLASSLPHHLMAGLTANGVPHDAAARVAQLPPVGVLFASLLGYNPIQSLLGPQVLGQLPVATQHHLTGHQFFPSLISPPFADGLGVAFGFAIAACLIAALASAFRGGKYVHVDAHPQPDADSMPAAELLAEGAE